MAQEIPPELAAMMQQGGQQQGSQMQAPTSSPMSTPQPNEGDKQGAMAQVQMAVDLLEQTLPAFGSESEEGRVILESLAKLGKQFGEKREKARGLIPSEIMNLVASLPKSSGGMPPQQGAPQGAPQQPPMQ